MVYDVFYTICYLKITQGYFKRYDVQTFSSTWYNTCPSNFQITIQIQLDSLYTGRASNFKFN